MATPSILRLPAELVIHVINFIHPEDHLSFASTCKRLHQLSDEVLEHHRRCHEEYSLSSDLHPLAVPTLLERMLLDPIAAWHVRDIEYWTSRQAWSHWHVVEPGLDEETRRNQFGPAQVLVDEGDPGNSAYVFTRDGNDHFKDASSAANVVDADMSSPFYEDVLRGSEKPLKLLVLGLASRMRSIKIPSLAIADGNQGAYSEHPLSLLSAATKTRLNVLSNLGPRPWPLGLNSLQSISVGVRARRDRPIVTVRFSVILPLLSLPNLEYLYVGHTFSGPSTEQIEKHLPRRTSTVQHVHITGGDLEISEMSLMINAIAKLKSFSLQSLHRNGCDVIRLLAMHHGESLEYLDMCDTDIHSRLHECYFSRTSLRSLAAFNSLKYIAIDLLVLLHQHIESQYAHPGQLVILKPRADVSRIDLCSILPHTLEFISFKLSNQNYTLSSPVADAVSDIVAHTIHSGAFARLHTIFFEDLVPQKQSQNQLLPHRPSDMAWFRGAMRAGMEGGVDVCTSWTHPGRKMRARKDELGIPRATSGRDMRSDVRNSR